MLPLIYADAGVSNQIKKVTGKQDTRKHLEDMGFLTGEEITVINNINGNLIVSVKNTKVALNKDLAAKIMI